MRSQPADQVTVAARFCGPRRSGNGGYVAGLLACAVDAPASAVEVSLLQPPPLDTSLAVRRSEDATELVFGGAVIARARAVADDIEAVDPVDLAVAVRASSGYPGHGFHPFPSCFGCGTERPDGLRIFPGPVAAAEDGSVRVAAVWTPGDDVAALDDEQEGHLYDDPAPRASPAATWAALDCIGAWSGDLGDRLVVLGRMTATLDDLPVVGEAHVVVGQAISQEGRKTFTSSTLYDPDGRIVGRARHVWVTVDPTLFEIQENSR